VDITDCIKDWFFDMIIGFLRSPRWKVPVMSFLDEKCIMFDNEEENKLEFTAIHNVGTHLLRKVFAGIQKTRGRTSRRSYEGLRRN
jgi:hypothetical protein